MITQQITQLVLWSMPVFGLGATVALVYLILKGRTSEERVQLIARFAQWGAWLVAGVWALGSAREIYRVIFSESIPVHIAVSPFWPVLPTEVSAQLGSARVAEMGDGDGFTDATMHVTGLSSVARGLIALEMFAVLVAVLTLCLLIVRAAAGITKGRVFGSIQSKQLVIAGTILTLAGITALFANGASQLAIFNEARPRQFSFTDMTWTANASDAHSQVFGIVSWSWSLDAPVWTFVAAGITFIAAMVVRRGNQLEIENEGLI